MANSARTVTWILALATVLACGPAPQEDVQPERTYNVRGVLLGIDEAEAPEWISIRHEPIADFVGVTGEPEPMDSMTMTFTLDPAVPIAGFATGQKVAFVLRVDWDADPPALVTSLSRLPDETELRFAASSN